ncbi:MAG: DUF4013 domain-containing protein [Planctomycetia bacterium]|nr:DUF4013 domain-containing protein [Planctomycetia bacterium]
MSNASPTPRSVVPPAKPAYPVARPAPILDVIAVAPPPRPPVLDAIHLPDVLPVAPPAVVEETGLPAVLPVSQPLFLKDPFGWIWWMIGSTVEWCFGAFALVLGLSILAAVPVAQFLTLGYLMEVSGRIARTGRFRDGFVGVWKAARVGSIVLGTALVLAPLYFVSQMAQAAQLVNPGGASAKGWLFALNFLTVVFSLHVVGAWSRGGKLHHFLWPSGNPVRLLRRLFQGEIVDVLGLVFLGNFWWLGKRLLGGGYYGEARDAVWNFLVSLRLPYYFWLGVRGFAGAFLCIAVPVSFLALGRLGPMIEFKGDPAQGGFLFVVVMFGWLVNSLVLLYVPFLQVHMAKEQRFSAMFEWREIRRIFKRAPIAFFGSFFVLLALALPLYILRIEQVPGDAGWLLAIFFIITIFPTRLLTGWAYARAMKKAETPSLRRALGSGEGWTTIKGILGFIIRWKCRLLMLLTAATYVFFLFFTQYTSGEGVLSLYGQHAFMLPVPFWAFD